METVFIILGALVILSLFNVGESIYKKLKVSHFAVCGVFALMLILMLLPTLNINNFSFSFGGFFLPLVYALKLIPKLKSKTKIAKFIVSFLLSTLFIIVLNIINPVNDIVYLISALILGVITFTITKRAYISYISLLFGLNSGMLLNFLISKGQSLLFGSYEVVSILLISSITSLILQCLYLRKTNRYQKKLQPELK